MKFFALFAALALMVSTASAANANGFVDQIITSIKSKPDMDPFHIPDQTVKVDRKHNGKDEHGHQHGHMVGDVHLNNMVITGLSHIARIGDADISNDNGSFAAHIHLGDHNIKVTGVAKVDLIKILHPHLKFEADIGNIAVKMGIVMVDGKAHLQEFDIDEFNHVKFHVHGLALLDPIIDVVGDVFVSAFNVQARHMLTVQLRVIIESQLQNFGGLGLN